MRNLKSLLSLQLWSKHFQLQFISRFRKVGSQTTISSQKKANEQKEKINKIRREEQELLDKKLNKIKSKISQQNKNEFDRKMHLNQQKSKFKSKERQNMYVKEDSSTTKYYDESQIQQLINNSKNPEQMFKLYNGHKFTFSLRNMITLLTKHANLIYDKSITTQIKNTDKRLQSLLFTLEANIQSLNNREKALIVWSLARCNLAEGFLDKLLASITNENKKPLDAKEISLIIWALAKLKLRRPQLFGKLSLNMCQLLDNPNIVIQSQQEIEEIESKLKKERLKNLKQMQELKKTESPEELATTLQKESEQDSKEEGKHLEADDDFAKLEQQIEGEDTRSEEERLMIIPAQSLVMCFWGFGKMRFRDEDFFDKLFKIIEKDSIKFNLRMMAIILYSSSNLNFKNKKAIDPVLSSISKFKDKEFKEQSVLTLKTLLVALSKLRYKDNGILQKICEHIIERNKLSKKPLSQRFVSEMLWCLSTSGCFQENLYKILAESVVKSVNEMNSRDLTQCFYSFCKYSSQSRSFDNVLNLLSTGMRNQAKDFDQRSKKIIKSISEEKKYKNKALTNFLLNQH